MEGFSLPKTERICSNRHIRAIIRNGARYSCAGAKLFVLPNQLPYNRFSCTFKRHYGCAVERNKARRLSKEAYRLMKYRLRNGFDIVLLLFPGKDVFSLRVAQLGDMLKKAELFSA